MRMITVLGFALLATGAIVLVASSGAFDATAADRGVEVETAADENALLGVERFGTDSDPILLADGDNCGLFDYCYEYNSEETIEFQDNTQSDHEIEIEEVTLENTGGNAESPLLDDWEVINENDAVIVEADLECDRDSGLFSPPQNGGEGELTVSAVMGESDDVTVELDRSVPIECEDE